MPQRFRYVVADVFTDTPLAGNQLAVFTDARDLPEDCFSRSRARWPSARPSSSTRRRRGGHADPDLHPGVGAPVRRPPDARDGVRARAAAAARGDPARDRRGRRPGAARARRAEDRLRADGAADPDRRAVRRGTAARGARRRALGAAGRALRQRDALRLRRARSEDEVAALEPDLARSPAAGHRRRQLLRGRRTPLEDAHVRARRGRPRGPGDRARPPGRSPSTSRATAASAGARRSRSRRAPRSAARRRSTRAWTARPTRSSASRSAARPSSSRAASSASSAGACGSRGAARRAPSRGARRDRPEPVAAGREVADAERVAAAGQLDVVDRVARNRRRGRRPRTRSSRVSRSVTTTSGTPSPKTRSFTVSGGSRSASSSASLRNVTCASTSRSNWSSKRTGPTSAQRTSPWPSYETRRPLASRGERLRGKSVCTSGATCTHARRRSCDVRRLPRVADRQQLSARTSPS